MDPYLAALAVISKSHRWNVSFGMVPALVPCILWPQARAWLLDSLDEEHCSCITNLVAAPFVGQLAGKRVVGKYGVQEQKKRSLGMFAEAGRCGEVE